MSSCQGQHCMTVIVPCNHILYATSDTLQCISAGHFHGSNDKAEQIHPVCIPGTGSRGGASPQLGNQPSLDPSKYHRSVGLQVSTFMQQKPLCGPAGMCTIKLLTPETPQPRQHAILNPHSCLRGLKWVPFRHKTALSCKVEICMCRCMQKHACHEVW